MTPNPDALAMLSAHLDGMKPRPISVSFLPGLALHAAPLRAEDAFKAAKAHDAKTTPAERARLLAEIVVAKVTHPDGEQAFAGGKGKAHPVETVLALSPELFSELVAAVLGDEAEAVAAADVVGKS